MSRSLKREHSAWYSQVLLGLTSGGGVQQTLSLIPVKTLKKPSIPKKPVKYWNHCHWLLTIDHVSLLHVALATGLTPVPSHSW